MDSKAARPDQPSPLIIASNRGPVVFEWSDSGEFTRERGSGGLVTALTGLARHMDTTWLACALTDADRSWLQGEVVLEEDVLQVRFLCPDEQAYQSYYNVIANPLLWFLQHSMWDLPRMPVIVRDTWRAWDDGYVVVNQMFAQAIAESVRAATRRPLVMLQDYHLYLVARYVRDRLPQRQRPTILHFVHIPWPGPSYWRVLPPTMRQAILEGLCGVDLLGFQTREDSRNFLFCCESYLPRAAVNYRRGRIWYRNHATHVRDFPISLDVAALQEMATSPEVRSHRADIDEMVGNRQLILRVDRIEPSKNIVRGFQAYEELLELYPQHRDRTTFLAILVPSRLEVREYRDYLDELMAVAGRINALYGSSQWEPVKLLIAEDYPRALAAMQRYDVLLVNAIADGMNLVAKEGPIVNRRDGVLILSESAGASQQLAPGALVISPCDVYASAEAMHQALVMEAPEKHIWAQRLRTLIEEEDINVWLRRQLEAVTALGL